MKCKVQSTLILDLDRRSSYDSNSIITGNNITKEAEIINDKIVCASIT